MEEKNRPVEKIVERMTSTPEVLTKKGSYLLRPSATPRGRRNATSIEK